MTTLEQRLFHLFDPRDRKRARHLVPEKVVCPRVGQVQATLSSDDGTNHEVFLELSANRRGGMILESRCTSPDGRAGKPCALVAAVLLEVDRRGLLSGIAEQTPVTLDIVVDEADDLEDIEAEKFSASRQENDVAYSGQSQSDGLQLNRNRHGEGRSGQKKGRQPAWSTELENRRRLVEPALRTTSVALGGLRKSTGTLMFLLDAASADSRLVKGGRAARLACDEPRPRRPGRDSERTLAGRPPCRSTADARCR